MLTFISIAVDGIYRCTCHRKIYEEVLSRIGAKGKVQLAHRNSSDRKDGGDYRALYSPQSQALVAQCHAREIEAVGYTF